MSCEKMSYECKECIHVFQCIKERGGENGIIETGRDSMAYKGLYDRESERPSKVKQPYENGHGKRK